MLRESPGVLLITKNGKIIVFFAMGNSVKYNSKI